jgi:hypothetical protein
MCYQEGFSGHYCASLCLFGNIALLGKMTNGKNYSPFSQMVKKFEPASLLKVTTQPSPDLLLVFGYNVRRSGVH